MGAGFTGVTTPPIDYYSPFCIACPARVQLTRIALVVPYILCCEWGGFQATKYVKLFQFKLAKHTLML